MKGASLREASFYQSFFIEKVYVLFGSKRQIDNAFVSVLNRIRVGRCSSIDVDYLNKYEICENDTKENFGPTVTHLLTTNKDVEYQNCLGIQKRKFY